MKRKAIKILGYVFLTLGVLALGVYVWTRSLKPNYEGTLKLVGVNAPVTVYFDDYGIPHIEAENELDATVALGYVHAQDRLWQMELLRRIGRGELSALFGERAWATDQLFLTLGIQENSQKQIDQLKSTDPEFQLLQAYLSGINQFQENGPTPIEFYLTGVKKRPFTILDVYNSLGYMAFSFAIGQRTDPMITHINNTLGQDYLEDLALEYDDQYLQIPHRGQLDQQEALAMVHWIDQAMNQLPVPSFIGSNSWVLGPEKTVGGKVILANDPHIGFSSPSVWYEAHIKTPNYEKYGYHIAGIPIPLLAHNKNYANGLTMFENDDLDLYQEKVNPNNPDQYLTDQGWADFGIRRYEIHVKGEENPRILQVKDTHHGPVISDLLSNGFEREVIASNWVYTQMEFDAVKSLYALQHAQDIAEFASHLHEIKAPGLNMMYGDQHDNIAWWAIGQLYSTTDSIAPHFIKTGVTTKNSHINLYPFENNPQSINPESHYVFTANNATSTMDGVLFPGYYAPDSRARRIDQLLNNDKKWAKEQVAEMMFDDTSSDTAELVNQWLKQMDQRGLSPEANQVIGILKQWEGSYGLDELAPAFFHRWEYEWLSSVFSDELGPDNFSQFLNTHFAKRLVRPLTYKSNSVWFDDVNTQEKEVKSDLLRRSFDRAMIALSEELGSNPKKWQWSKVHTVTHGHPLGSISILAPLFNVGPYAATGSREVINNMAFKYTGSVYYAVDHGPSTRRIVDFSDIEHSMSILPTGQSGNPFSPHYNDQADLFHQGKFRLMMMNWDEIKAQSTRLNLLPN